MNDTYQLLLGVAIVRFGEAVVQSVPTLYALYQGREVFKQGWWGTSRFGPLPPRTTRRQSKKRKRR